MKVRIFLFLSLFLICLTYVSQATTYSVLGGSDLTIDNKIYKVDASYVDESNFNKTVLVFKPYDENLSKFILEFGKTKAANDHLFEFVAQAYASDSRHNLHDLDGAKYQYTIDATPISAFFTISKTVSPSELLFKDMFNITISMKNSGNEDVVIEYREKLPSYYKKGELLIIWDDGEHKPISSGLADEIYWKGTIKKDLDYKIVQKAQLVGFEPGNYKADTLQGQLKYNLAEQEIMIDTPVVSARRINPIAAELSFERPTAEPDESIKFGFTLQNHLEGSDILINELILRLPEDMYFTNNLFGKELERLSERELIWDGMVFDEVDKDFTISVAKKTTTDSNITITVKYLYRGFNITDTFSKGLDMDYSGATATLSSKKTTYSGGDNISVEAYLVNNEKDMILRNIEFTLESDFFPTQNLFFVSLSEGNKIVKLLKKKAPYSDKSRNYNVVLHGSYETAFGDKSYFNQTLALSVSPADNARMLSIRLYALGNNSDGSQQVALNISKNSQDTIYDATIFADPKTRKNEISLDEDELAELNANSSVLIVRDIMLSQTNVHEIVSSLSYGQENETYMSEVAEENIIPDAIIVYADLKEPEKEEEPIQEIAANSTSSVNPFEEKNAWSRPAFGMNVGTFYKGLAVMVIVIVFGGLILLIAGKKKNKDPVQAAIAAAGSGSGMAFSRQPSSVQQSLGQAQQYKSQGSVSGQAQCVPMASAMAANAASDIPNADSLDFNQLEDHIRKCQATGKKPDSIKKELIAAGWNSDVIDAFLRHG